MELIRGLSSLRPRHQGSVVTIGTFDGIHPGHRALIDSLLAHGRRLGRPAMMLTFEPMPREYLAAANPPARLTSWRERWRVLQRTGLEPRAAAEVRREAADASPARRSRGCWRTQLKAGAVVIGHDFRFGRNGEATAPMLVEAGRRLGFEVDVVEPVLVDGERVSSSDIRVALSQRRPGAGGTPARPAVFDDRARGARPAAGAQPGVPHGEPAARPQAHAAAGNLRGARARHRRAAECARRCEPRHAADGGRHRAAARGACVRLQRRPVRPRDRSGVRVEAARRAALREPRRAGSADESRMPRRRAQCSRRKAKSRMSVADVQAHDQPARRPTSR